MPRPTYPNIDAAVRKILKEAEPFAVVAVDATRWYAHYKMGQFAGPEEDLKRSVMATLTPLGDKLAELVVAYDDIFAYLKADSRLTEARNAIERNATGAS